jgi:hypothetical protein
VPGNWLPITNSHPVSITWFYKSSSFEIIISIVQMYIISLFGMNFILLFMVFMVARCRIVYFFRCRSMTSYFTSFISTIELVYS